MRDEPTTIQICGLDFTIDYFESYLVLSPKVDVCSIDVCCSCPYFHFQQHDHPNDWDCEVALADENALYDFKARKEG